MPNRIDIEGNIVRAPELKYTPKGKVYLSISIASNNNTKKDDKEYKESYYPSCILWWNAEKWADWLHKGTSVMASGRIRQENWTGKDGSAKYADKVILSSIGLTAPWAGQATNNTAQPPEEFVPEFEDDGL